MARGPFSYADPVLIEHDLLAAGFTRTQLETVALTTRVSAGDAAQGLVLGSPFRSEIERRDPSGLKRALEAVTAALARWDGNDAPMSAHIVTATAEGSVEPKSMKCGARCLSWIATFPVILLLEVAATSRSTREHP